MTYHLLKLLYNQMPWEFFILLHICITSRWKDTLIICVQKRFKKANTSDNLYIICSVNFDQYLCKNSSNSKKKTWEIFYSRRRRRRRTEQFTRSSSRWITTPSRQLHLRRTHSGWNPTPTFLLPCLRLPIVSRRWVLRAPLHLQIVLRNLEKGWFTISKFILERKASE